MSKYLHGITFIVVAVLAFGCWYYRGSASDWEQSSNKQKHRAETAEQANDTLVTANASLNARNDNLVDSLDARTDQLTKLRKSSDANRAAYRSALDKNFDWGSTLIPIDVADSLRAGTSGKNAATSKTTGAQ